MLNKNIIKSEKAYEEILKFEPQKLISTTVESMDELIKIKEMNNDFLISDVVKNFTGLAELEGKRAEREIEKKALEELKTVQEQAYAEAYELGLSEGIKKAFIDNSEIINTRINELDLLIKNIRDSKIHFLNSNESQLMKMVFYLATKVALFEVSKQPNEAIIKVLKECIKISHGEEKIKVGVSPIQVEFLETLQKEQNREYEFLKNVEIIPQDGVRAGGCVITTNYTEINAQIEERIEKLWSEMLSIIPPIKDQVENG